MRPRLVLLILASLGRAAAGGEEMSGPGSGAVPVSAPPAAGSGDDLAERVRRLEELNRELLDAVEVLRDREADRDRRYRELEGRYREVLGRLDEAVRPADVRARPPDPAPAAAGPTTGAPSADPGGAAPPRPGSGGGRPEVEPVPEPGRDYPIFEADEAPPLAGRLRSGFELVTPDEEFSLGVRVLNQVDFKTYAPNDLNPAAAGLYLPRTRFYFEGNLTRPLYYEVSVQRSVEGNFDLLDAYLNARITEGFQIKFGRTIAPYSYDWYDHLEPYFITPERSLFPLNFGLSRQAGLMAWGLLADGRLEYAVGGFTGSRIGLSDSNTVRDAVGYLNWRPFLAAEGSPLRNLNLGGSIAGGQSVRPGADRPVPLRTSIQSTENDEAAARGVDRLPRVRGGRPRPRRPLPGGAAPGLVRRRLVDRGRGPGRPLPVRPRRPARPAARAGRRLPRLRRLLPDRRGAARPRHDRPADRPFDPFHDRWGPGALEPFARVSQLHLGERGLRLRPRRRRTSGPATSSSPTSASTGTRTASSSSTSTGSTPPSARRCWSTRPAARYARAADLFWVRLQFWF